MLGLGVRVELVVAGNGRGWTVGVRRMLVLVVGGPALGPEVVCEGLVAMSELVLGGAVVAPGRMVEVGAGELASTTVTLHGHVAGAAVSEHE